MSGKVLEQAEEERKVDFSDALFVEGQNESAAFGLEMEIGIFDALSDALEALGRTDLVASEDHGKFFEGNVGVDRHGKGHSGGARRIAGVWQAVLPMAYPLG